MAAFNYLIAEKNKQTKIADIQYSSLEMQEYMMDGDMVIDVTKFICKARSKTLDIKAQRNGNMKTKPVLVAKLAKTLVARIMMKKLKIRKSIIDCG